MTIDRSFLTAIQHIAMLAVAFACTLATTAYCTVSTYLNDLINIRRKLNLVISYD